MMNIEGLMPAKSCLVILLRSDNVRNLKYSAYNTFKTSSFIIKLTGYNAETSALHRNIL